MSTDLSGPGSAALRRVLPPVHALSILGLGTLRLEVMGRS